MEECLIETHKYITQKLETDMQPHSIKYSGRTKKSIQKDAIVKWEGAMAEIEVGFKINEGGMPSIFLLYGTQRMEKDTKLYNDIYGSLLKKEIAEIQEKILNKKIEEIMGG